MTFKLSELPISVATALRAHAQAGTLFTDAEINGDEDLFRFAHTYAEQYTGDAPFMIDIQRQAASGAWLSPAQGRGVLNFAVRSLRRALGQIDAATRQNGPLRAPDSEVARPADQPCNGVTSQLRAAERARSERVRLYAVEGRAGVYRTLSKSNPKDHHTVMALPGGIAACSCLGYQHRGECKHSSALITKLAREAARAAKHS